MWEYEKEEEEEAPAAHSGQTGTATKKKKMKMLMKREEMICFRLFWYDENVWLCNDDMGKIWNFSVEDKAKKSKKRKEG